MPGLRLTRSGGLHLSEAQVTTQVIDWLRLEGWRPVRTDADVLRGEGGRTAKVIGEAGQPDWLLRFPVPHLHPAAWLEFWLELKASDGRVRRHQRLWHDAARARGELVAVARSLDELRAFLRDHDLPSGRGS